MYSLQKEIKELQNPSSQSLKEFRIQKKKKDLMKLSKKTLCLRLSEFDPNLSKVDLVQKALESTPKSNQIFFH